MTAKVEGHCSDRPRLGGSYIFRPIAKPARASLPHRYTVPSSCPRSDECETPPAKKPRKQSANTEEITHANTPWDIQDPTKLVALRNAKSACEDEACDGTAWAEPVQLRCEDSLRMARGTGGSAPSIKLEHSLGDDASSGGDCGPDHTTVPDGKPRFEPEITPGMTPGTIQGVAVIQNGTGTIVSSDAVFQQICSAAGAGNLPEGFVQMQCIAVNIAARFQWANAANQLSMNMLPVSVGVPAECPRISINGYAVRMQCHVQGTVPVDTILWTIQGWSPVLSPKPVAVGKEAYVAAHMGAGAHTAPGMSDTSLKAYMAAHTGPGAHTAPNLADTSSSAYERAQTLPGQVVKHRSLNPLAEISVWSPGPSPKPVAVGKEAYVAAHMGAGAHTAPSLSDTSLKAYMAAHTGPGAHTAPNLAVTSSIVSEWAWARTSPGQVVKHKSLIPQVQKPRTKFTGSDLIFEEHTSLGRKVSKTARRR